MSGISIEGRQPECAWYFAYILSSVYPDSRTFCYFNGAHSVVDVDDVGEFPFLVDQSSEGIWGHVLEFNVEGVSPPDKAKIASYVAKNFKPRFELRNGLYYMVLSKDSFKNIWPKDVPPYSVKSYCDVNELLWLFHKQRTREARGKLPE